MWIEPIVDSESEHGSAVSTGNSLENTTSQLYITKVGVPSLVGAGGTAVSPAAHHLEKKIIGFMSNLL